MSSQIINVSYQHPACKFNNYDLLLKVCVICSYLTPTGRPHVLGDIPVHTLCRIQLCLQGHSTRGQGQTLLVQLQKVVHSLVNTESKGDHSCWQGGKYVGEVVAAV